jgi:hypothetical protein
MEDHRRQKWITILFFSMSGIIFGTALYLITANSAPPSATPAAAVASAADTLPYPDAPQVKVVLERDTPLRLGKLDLIYRGVQDRKLRLDVIVLDLDPEYAYRHAIALDKARRGFRLGGIDLQLLSARQGRAKVVWHRRS